MKKASESGRSQAFCNRDIGFHLKPMQRLSGVVE